MKKNLTDKFLSFKKMSLTVTEKKSIKGGNDACELWLQEQESAQIVILESEAV